MRDAWSLGLLSRNARSETKEEKDIMLVTLSTKRSDKCMKFSAQGYLSMLTEAGAQCGAYRDSGDLDDFNSYTYLDNGRNWGYDRAPGKGFKVFGRSLVFKM